MPKSLDPIPHPGQHGQKSPHLLHGSALQPGHHFYDLLNLLQEWCGGGDLLGIILI
jgi:hypothetical protein